MSGKILVNSSIVTKAWREGVGRILCFCLLVPCLVLVLPVGLIWFVSLGHINLFSFWLRYYDMLDIKTFGD